MSESKSDRIIKQGQYEELYKEQLYGTQNEFKNFHHDRRT
jgi:hypothetical protein